MRALALLIFDVVVTVAMFVAGGALQSALGLELWFLPMSMLPGVCWMWFRGAIPQRNMLWVLLWIVAYSLYLAIKDALWRNQPDWSIAVDFAAVLVVMSVIDRLLDRFGPTRGCSASNAD